MKTARLSDIRKRNAERRQQGLQATRRANPDFVPRMRVFDKPRQNPEKQIILKKMWERELEVKPK